MNDADGQKREADAAEQKADREKTDDDKKLKQASERAQKAKSDV